MDAGEGQFVSIYGSLACTHDQSEKIEGLDDSTYQSFEYDTHAVYLFKSIESKLLICITENLSLYDRQQQQYEVYSFSKRNNNQPGSQIDYSK